MTTRTLLAAIAMSVLAFAATDARATLQVPDVIIVDGRNASLDANPLAPYLSANPAALPRSDVPSTENLRGYVATWEIRDAKLLLRKIEVAFGNPKAPPNEDSRIIKNVIRKVFPDSKDPVAVWYSGALVIPGGRLIRHVHMGYGSTYESYTVITVRKGVISRRLDLSADDFAKHRESQFEAFKRTSDYENRFREAKSFDPSYSDEFVERALQSSESEHYLAIDFDATR